MKIKTEKYEDGYKAILLDNKNQPIWVEIRGSKKDAILSLKLVYKTLQANKSYNL